MRLDIKKSIIIIFIFLLLGSVVFANGSKEVADKLTNGENYGDLGDNSVPVGIKESMQMYDITARGLLARLITQIGSVLGEMSANFVIAIHPFPGILANFYEFDGSSGKLMIIEENAKTFKADEELLISNNFYSNNKTIANAPKQIQTELKSTIGVQKIRWNIITTLFIVLFAAEIIFFTIWNYITGKDTFLFKELVTKVAMCLVIFILCSSLPYLLEAIRYGLTRIAEDFTGHVGTNYNMLMLPATFLSEMSILMDFLDPSNGGVLNASLNNEKETSKSGVISGLLTGLVYLIFKFFMFFELIKAGLHIMMNIIEVYFLLTVVMIIMPFSIFTPTKSFGEKCVMSLFNNLIECFILLLMVVMIVPASLAVSYQLLTLIMGDQFGFKSFNATVANVSGKQLKENVNITDFFNVPNNSVSNYEQKLRLVTKTTFAVNNEGIIAYMTIPSLYTYTTNDVLKKDKMTSVTFVAYYAYKEVGNTKINDYFLTKQEELATAGITKNSEYLIIESSLPGSSNAPLKPDKITLRGDAKDKVVNNKIRFSPTGVYNKKVYEGEYSQDPKVMVEILSRKENDKLYLDYDLWYNEIATIFTNTMFILDINHRDPDDKNTNTTLNYSIMIKDLRTFLGAGLDYFTGSEKSLLNALRQACIASSNAYKSDDGLENFLISNTTNGLVAKNDTTVSDVEKDNKMLRHLVIMFVCLYIPCYMIQQSSQITQALMQGGIAHESISNALTQQTQQMAKGAANVGATVAGAALKGAVGTMTRGSNSGVGTFFNSALDVARQVPKSMQGDLPKNNSPTDQGIK